MITEASDLLVGAHHRIEIALRVVRGRG